MGRPRLRAPETNGSVLSVPPVHEIAALLDRNQQIFESAEADIGGISYPALRGLAISETISVAMEFMSEASLEVPDYCVHPRGPSPENRGLIVTGHQPEMFHPGVWIKNFAAHALGRAHNLISANLIVDGDVAKSTSIKMPDFGKKPIRLVPLSFDEWAGPAPFEELNVDNHEVFDQFPESLEPLIAQSGEQPIAQELWKRTGLSSNLGMRISTARHAQEMEWGCHNLELPASRLCRLSSFGRFACHILKNAHRFREIFNDILVEYRGRHKLRSHSHPFPDLAQSGEWIETPFWFWRAGRSRRNRMFARAVSKGIEIGRPEEILTTLAPDCGETQAQAFQDLDSRNIRVRTRALTTTLFARLFVAELFIHGIGGAIYDEITDELVRRYYGIEPPEYMVVTGTLHLPLNRQAPEVPDTGTVRQQLRDLWHNPDRYSKGVSGEADRLASRKRDWINTVPTSRPQRRERFSAIRGINEQLRPMVEARRSETVHRLEESQIQETERAILLNREYSYCLFPRDLLREFLTKFR